VTPVSTPLADLRLETIPEVAERLRCSPSHVKDLIRNGQLESIKLGRARRVPADAVDRLISDLRTQQGAA
jgi:excisionase family DNA binding protein